MRPHRWALLLVMPLFAVLLQAAAAAARTEGTCRYTKVQTYSAALRYLRVDLGYEVVEKDPDAAYLIFRYQPSGQCKSASGSIEIVESRDEVKVLVQLPRMPSYHEAMLRDGLLRKLRREYGAPPRPERKPEPDGEDEPDEDDGGDGRADEKPAPRAK